MFIQTNCITEKGVNDTGWRATFQTQTKTANKNENHFTYLKVTEVVLLKGQNESIKELSVVARSWNLRQFWKRVSAGIDITTEESNLGVVEGVDMLSITGRKSQK